MTSDEPEDQKDPDESATYWGELDPDQQRVQVRVEESVRDYIAERSDDEGATYSELITAWLPADGSIPGTGEVKALKLTPEAHQRVKDQTQGWFRQGEVVAYYALLDALERGDGERAAELAAHAPTTLVADVTDALSEEDDG